MRFVDALQDAPSVRVGHSSGRRSCLFEESGNTRRALVLPDPERTPTDLVTEYPAHLHIDLLERARGQGLGRVLTDRLFADLRREGIRGIHLGVDPDNANGIGFYEHLGFREVGREPGGLLMGLTLG